MAQSWYEVLGIQPECSFLELRSAYRAKARALHPDVSTKADSGTAMVALNEAWRVLSDESLRADYDLSLKLRTHQFAGPSSRSAPQPSQGNSTWCPPVPAPTHAGSHWADSSTGVRPSRRQAWVAGVQAQIGRLAQLSGRSATQTLLLKNPRGGREHYEQLVQVIVASLMEDTEARVRSARAAGATPLDLGVAATLIGVRTMAAGVRRESSLGLRSELLMTADLLDRMWDILAHELTTTLSAALGGNPQVSKAIAA